MPARTFELSVPLDLTEIADTARDDKLKVVARAADGTVTSSTVTIRGDARTAKLTFPDHPGAVTVAVGPVAADDSQILDADTIGLHVPSRYWEDAAKVSLSPLKVGLWHWGWWKRWCRTITVTGRMVCPDGRPVPGATVTAYDIDSFFIWTSKQALGSQTTAADGTFTMTFTWCCGIYPWWWWFRVRPWMLDPRIAERVHEAAGKLGDVRFETPDAAAVARGLRADARPGRGRATRASCAAARSPSWSRRTSRPPASGCSRSSRSAWARSASGPGCRGRRGATAAPTSSSPPPRTAVTG